MSSVYARVPDLSSALPPTSVHRAPSSASAQGAPADDAKDDAPPAAGNNLAASLAASQAASNSDTIRLAKRHLSFDLMVAEKSEDERELQLLENLMMQRLKNDDEITKAWLRLA